MVSRAFGFAAMLLLVGGGLARPVQAQENLDAGKSPSQLFSGTCSACHKSPRGLLKTVPAGSLQGFLRQHYTTSPEMAGGLGSYLVSVSNGAADARYTGGKEAKSDTKSEAKPETAPSERSSRRHRRSATEPAASGEAAPAPEASADTEPKPRARHGRHRPRPDAATEAKSDGDSPSSAADDGRRHSGRKSAKHRRGKPAGDETAKPDAASEAPSEAAKPAAEEKSPAESRAEAPKSEAPKESAPPTTTQSIPAGGSDSSVPTAPSH